MKNLIFFIVVFFNCMAFAQDIIFDKNYFRNKKIENDQQKLDFTGFASQFRFDQTNVGNESVVLIKTTDFKSQYTYHQVKFKNKKVPEMMDYNDRMQCGPLQPRNSEDMMIHAIKYYLFNKYILGAFVKTSFN